MPWAHVVVVVAKKKQDENEPLLLTPDDPGRSSQSTLTVETSGKDPVPTSSAPSTPIHKSPQVDITPSRAPKNTSGMVIYFREGDEKKEERIRGLDISFGEFILLALRKAGALPEDGSMLAMWLPPLPPPPKGQKSYTLPTHVDIEKMKQSANEWKLIYPNTSFPPELIKSHILKVKLIKNPDYVPPPLPEPIQEEDPKKKEKKEKIFRFI